MPFISHKPRYIYGSPHSKYRAEGEKPFKPSTRVFIGKVKICIKLNEEAHAPKAKTRRKILIQKGKKQ